VRVLIKVLKMKVLSADEFRNVEVLKGDV